MGTKYQWGDPSARKYTRARARSDAGEKQAVRRGCLPATMQPDRLVVDDDAFRADGGGGGEHEEARTSNASFFFPPGPPRAARGAKTNGHAIPADGLGR